MWRSCFLFCIPFAVCQPSAPCPSFTHTQHCHTHNITQRCRTQLFHTDNFVTHNPFTCNFVTHNSSETFTDTTLSHTSGDSDAPFAWPRGAGVAFGDMDVHFVWQAWHLVTLMLAWRGRYGTWRR